MPKHIVVINPNSNQSVTAAMDRCVQTLRFDGGPTISCLTLAEGPLGIETSRHVDEVSGPLCALISREDNRADAFVIACFGDPGLHAARETTSKPVIGICEGGISSALNAGERFGILANLPGDVNSGVRHVRALGMEARLAGVEAAGVAVTELDDAPRAKAGLTAAANRLKQRGADVLIMGCAGMLPYADLMEKETGLQVIDPVHAATGLALTAACAR